jgi:acetyl-CoA carboxylase carboxyltransferase component
VPRIAVVKGRCFAGNAVIAGCADLIVATEDASIGMGGPAMIAGGGLGDVHPDDVGPISMQAPNGVVDVVVADEAEAVAVTKRLLAYFQGPTEPASAGDQTRLRTMVPERARRAYKVTPIIETLADDGSVTSLRERFAPEMVTALARIEGRAVGVIANNTMVMAGAITAAASDKAARFLQLCDAFDLPVVSLVDCPGYMVGPAAEAEALVRRRWSAAVCTSRCSPWRGRAPTSARWASRERSGLGCARSSSRSPTTTRAKSASGRRRLPLRQMPRRSTPLRCLRSTMSSIPPTRAP